MSEKRNGTKQSVVQAIYRPTKTVFSALKNICRHIDTINGLKSVSESLAGIHFWRKLCSNTRSDNYPTNLFEFIARMREVTSFTFLLQKIGCDLKEYTELTRVSVGSELTPGSWLSQPPAKSSVFVRVVPGSRVGMSLTVKACRKIVFFPAFRLS